jgi:hypothetical protein
MSNISHGLYCPARKGFSRRLVVDVTDRFVVWHPEDSPALRVATPTAHFAQWALVSDARIWF